MTAEHPGLWPLIFVTGGSRSGKSAFALSLAERYFSRRPPADAESPAFLPVRGGLFVATARVEDEEMRRRVERHRQERGDHWRVFEVAKGEEEKLPPLLPHLLAPGELVLLDCLTLWVSACMEAHGDDEFLISACRDLFTALRALPCPVIVVSNEVGLGLVPPTSEGRRFRDLAGLANQQAAACADAVAFMVSGLPLQIKGSLDLHP